MIAKRAPESSCSPKTVRPLFSIIVRTLFVVGCVAGVAMLAMDLWPRGQAPVADVEPPAPAPEVEVAEKPAHAGPEVTNGTVQPGDTFSTLLERHLDPRELKMLIADCGKVFSLTSLRAGKPYSILTLKQDFLGFEYQISDEEKLIVRRDWDGFWVKRRPLKYDVETVAVEGRIDSSLFQAVSAAGEKPELAVRLAEIFAWEIDFLRDLRQGDAFRVLVEKRFRKGVFTGYGEILAAEFVNQGESFQGFRHKAADGQHHYYGAKGESLRKAFLKAPLKFTRISSGFTNRRLHPVTGEWKAHPAIDYAAPTGTPVMAVADGVVQKAEYGRGNGNCVKLKHASGYVTMYLHLHGYAKGVKPGVRVKQGQLIGYVGSTGLSTGPHLDFRMTLNGKFVNPTTIKSVRAEPLTGKALTAFKAMVAEREALMATAGVKKRAVQVSLAGGNDEEKKN